MTPITLRRLSALAFILLLTVLPLKAENTVNTSFTIIEGTKKGLGAHFSFVFDNSWTPSAAYYDLETMSLKYARVSRGRWIIEKVADGGFIENGQYCSLKYDKLNNPHIAYLSDKKTLHLAKKEKDKWIIEEVDNQTPSGAYCCLTLNNGNEPSISYQSERGTMIAQKLIGSWLIQKIDDKGLATYINRTASGNTVIYYILQGDVKNGGAQVLKSAENNGSGWVSKVIPGTGGCLDFSVAYNKAGSPFVAYTRGGSVRMYRESVPGSGIWKEEEIEATDVTGLSILPGNKDLPVICYISGNGTELKVARFDGSSWDVKKTVSTKSAFKLENCAITADGKGRELLIISNGDSLNVLINKRGGWALGRIDGRVRAGAHINLNLLQGDAPAVCYFSPARKDLSYARTDPSGQWQVQTVDAVGNVGHYAVMKSGADGNSVIAYYDKTRGDLKFTEQTGKSWVTSRIDTGRDTGHFPSIHLNSDGNPFISYSGTAPAQLNFAHRRGHKWIREKVSPLGPYGGPSFVFADDSGNPAILFIDGHKVEKPAPNQSPVSTSIKLAVKNKKSWDVTTLAGPFEVSISNQAFSGSVGPGGMPAICYIDREDNLRVLEKSGTEWTDHKVDAGCLGPAVIRHAGENPAVLYISGKTPDQSELKLARLKEGQWIISKINTPVRMIKYIDFAFGEDGLFRIASGDQENFFATYIVEKK